MSRLEVSRSAQNELQSPAPEANKLVFGAGALKFCLAGILAIHTAVECHNVATQAIGHTSWTPSVLYGATVWLWWFGIALGLWWCGKRKPLMWELSTRNAVLQFAAGSAVALLHLKVLQWTMHFMMRTWPYLVTIGYGKLVFLSLERFCLDLALYALIWAGCVVVRLQVHAYYDRVIALELRHQLSEARLYALQMQMEPHFLFNTLNAITTLVELGRQAEAVEALAHLNVILKTTLSQGTPEKIPLARELEFIENYLAIEQIRFADRLKVEMKVTSAALDGLVPCFLLQPIIENAIRHGIAHLEEEGTIQTSIHREGDKLQFIVRDNGPGLKVQSIPGHGIGLKNTEQRLSHFYQNAYRFVATEPESGGFEVSITIPYERGLP